MSEFLSLEQLLKIEIDKTLNSAKTKPTEEQLTKTRNTIMKMVAKKLVQEVFVAVELTKDLK